MPLNIDSRKVSITDIDDAIAFVKFVESKLPQVVAVLDKSKMNAISLKNRVNHYKGLSEQGAPAPAPANVDPDAGVLRRISKKPPTSKAQDRLNEMRNAGKATDTTPEAPMQTEENPVDTGDNLANEIPPAPVAPGEIGNLSVPHVDQTAPNPNIEPPAVPEAPSIPEDPGTVPEVPAPTAPSLPAEDSVSSEDIQTEEDAALAAGSKSELAPDSDLQPEDPAAETQSSQEEVDDILTAPSSDDVTGVGDRLARKTDNGKANLK